MSDIERYAPPPPPGWYPDANGLQRWWDGNAWGVYAPLAPTQPAPPARYTPPQKDTAVAYVLAIFLGGLGIHHFYLGQPGQAVAMLCLWLFGWVTSFFLVGFFLLAGVGVWLIVDLFLIPGYVRAANARAAGAIYR
jgi:TM2 domain-containing membrane protein YozV